MSKQWFPTSEDLEFNLTLSKALNRSVHLMREQISRWAFEIGLRKAYARRRYYKRLYGKNRVLWGR